MSIKKINIFIGITILVFMLIYYPPIIGVNTIHLLAVMSYIYLFKKRYIGNIIIKIIKEFSLPIFGILLLLLVNSIFIWNNHKVDMGLVVMAFETVPIAIVISKLKNEKLPNVDFIDILVTVAVIQACIAFLAFMIPSFHSLIIGKYLSYGFNDIIGKMAGWRMYGYSYTMAYAMPVTQSIIASISIYKGMKKGWWYYIATIFIFLSAVINARVSIVLTIIGAIGAIMFANRANTKNVIKILVVILLALFVLEKGLCYLENSESETSVWLMSGIEDLKAFFNGNSLENDSYFIYATDKERYRLPDSILDVVFGTGNTTTRGNSNYQSDIGYINDIWYGGLVFFASILYFYVSKLKKLFIFLKKNYGVSFLLFYVVLGILLAANIKGRCFSWNEITQLLMMCFIYYRYEHLVNITSRNLNE